MKRSFWMLFFILGILSTPAIADSIPQYPDVVVASRIERLNRLSPIEFEYNEAVKSYIEAYAVKNTEKVSRILGLSEYYFPVFESYLDKYNLPFELKYLAAVESALDQNAVSRSGAVGLWQIMNNTAKLLGLRSDSYIDERRDVYRSTEAACRYLEYLYRTFGDWQLALAAYNGGPGMVKKAIAKSGGKTNYWEIRPYLTPQMQNYVPAFIAMNYVVKYASEHSIKPSTATLSHYILDTVNVKGPIAFDAISELIDWPADSILWLNPMFRLSFIPEDTCSFSLVLPEQYMLKYLFKPDSIDLSQQILKDYPSMLLRAGDTLGLKRSSHLVKKGETLHRIAMQYDCTLQNINAWNNLSETHRLKYDEQLIIWGKP